MAHPVCELPGAGPFPSRSGRRLVAVELRRHLRDRGGGILFRGVRGAEVMRRDQFHDSAWKPALRAAGLSPGRFKFHALRHFCASTLLAEGAPITAVAGHIGDTVETVSRVYAHWLRDDRDVPADVLDRVLAPPAASRPRHQGGVGGG
jgi:integrase